jgi:integrase
VGVTVRDWKGAWWIFVNHRGRRKAKRVGTGEEGKKAAKQVAHQLEARLALGQPAFQEDKAGVKLAEYAKTWLDRIRHIRKHTTAEDYRKMLDRDILPALRGLDLKDITREKVKAVAFEGLKKGQSPKTVQNVIRCLSSLLSHAVEDGLLIVNPALKPGKFLRCS